jgi:hypothetical protein
VAAQELAVGKDLLRDGVGLGEGEYALLRLRHFPLLRVLGREHAEFVAVVGDGLVLIVLEVVCLHGCAEVELARGDH